MSDTTQKPAASAREYLGGKREVLTKAYEAAAETLVPLELWSSEVASAISTQMDEVLLDAVRNAELYWGSLEVEAARSFFGLPKIRP